MCWRRLPITETILVDSSFGPDPGEERIVPPGYRRGLSRNAQAFGFVVS